MAMIAGALLDIGGTALLGESAEDRIKNYKKMMGRLGTPDPSLESGKYFDDLEKFYPRASTLSKQAREEEMADNLALRERALPGIGAATSDAMASISPLLRGELPPSVMDAFTRAGGASTVGLGMGGTGFGALNTGLFGARGALGAIQTGMGLLPSLLSTMPAVSAPTTMGLLGQLMTPQERINLQMQLRQQQIGINNNLTSLPTRMDVWGTSMKQAGGMLMGGGGMGFGGGMGGGGGGSGEGGLATGSGASRLSMRTRYQGSVWFEQ